MIKNLFKNIGPGTLVAAAFIGPGTVTLCTLAGVNFGFNLLWAMVLSIVATIVISGLVLLPQLINDISNGSSEVNHNEQLNMPLAT